MPRSMPIVPLLITLAIFGAVLYLIQLIPMDPAVRTLIRVVAIVAIVLWLLNDFGLLHGAHSHTWW